MFKRNLPQLVRNLLRDKASTLINILGLSLSIACCIFVYSLIDHESTFDNFHKNADQTYRLVSDIKTPEGLVHRGNQNFAIAKSLRTDFPQLEYVTQVFSDAQAFVTLTGKNQESRKFAEKGLTYADEYFLSVFDYKIIAKSGNKLLSTPDEVILTKPLADKYFQSSAKNNYQDVLGKTVVVNKKSYKISAILEDIPSNTNVHFNILLSIKALDKIFPGITNDWKLHQGTSFTFITLPDNYSPQAFEKALVTFKNKYLDQEKAKQTSYYLQALKKVHTDTRYGGTIYSSPKILVVALSIMGVLVLLTACINFINLATAQALKRAKEIGIRKALGCSSAALKMLIIGETLIIVCIASVLGIFIASRFIQTFNNFISFAIDVDLVINSRTMYFLAALIVVTTILAGFYPAKMAANYPAIQALKSSIHKKHKSFTAKIFSRKGLIVVQFITSQMLIIGTLVVAMQMRSFENMDLGYSREGMYALEIPENNPAKQEILRNELSKIPEIQDVSFSSSPPISNHTSFSDLRLSAWPENQKLTAERKSIDHRFLPTYGIGLVAGRNFMSSDSANLRKTTKYNVLINEKASRVLGFKQPNDAIGQNILVDKGEQATVVGVVKDYFNVSLQDEIEPSILAYATNWSGVANIRFTPAMRVSEETFTQIQKAWEKLYPDDFYGATLFNDYLNKKPSFIIHDIMYRAFKIFVFLSIIIGCVGLYGLTSYMAVQREKEIGIRKVLGSSVTGIVLLFSKEFTALVSIAFLFAAPTGYLVMKLWLQTFPKPITIHAGYFLSAFAISLTIAAITISSKTLRAALANPIKSLRTE